MKIETIYCLERLNKGNYEHLELSATAKVEEGEDAFSALLALKTLINTALTAKAEEIKKEKEIPKKVEVVEEKVKTPKSEVVEEVKEEPKKKEKKEKKEKVKEEKKENFTPYSKDNKHVLQAYLTSKYADAWKTCKPKEEIIAFTSQLQGKDFLDSKGNIIESFLVHIHEFFGE